MINFDKLDTTKTYIGLEYGSSSIAKIIAKYTREYCYNREHIPSHIFALVYDEGCKQWMIYESHMKGSSMGCLASGVRRYYRVILQKVFPQVCFSSDVYQLDLDKEVLNKLIGKPYGVGDIFALMKASLAHNNGKQKNRIGYICSEYIALAFKPIQQYFNLPSWCITPSHFLRYVLDNKIPLV